jgi:hypothetical protein
LFRVSFVKKDQHSKMISMEMKVKSISGIDFVKNREFIYFNVCFSVKLWRRIFWEIEDEKKGKAEGILTELFIELFHWAFYKKLF